MKVLIVDDDPFALKIFSRQLTMLGVKDLELHQNALSALTQLEDHTGSDILVFCDLQMPEMDGIEFVRNLDRIGYVGGLVLVSGENKRILQSAHELATIHNLNILGSLAKPVRPQSLREILYGRSLDEITNPPADIKSYTVDELKQALGNSELINYYQPKIEIASGRLAGLEALVRWQHPEDGLVFPDQFIPLAEEAGLIQELTYYVISTALQHIAQWREQGYGFHVAVNISMDDLSSLDFPDRLEKAAKDLDITLSDLTLELTESRLMLDRQASLDILTRLRLKNTSLSIDDFGTGHSSLAQLRDIPFDELKIDQGFVHGAWRDDAKRAIFEASLDMAKKLGMRTVAEGVEDQEDWDFLKGTGCDLAQGYFIAKPMPVADLCAWMETWEEFTDTHEVFDPNATQRC